MSIEQPQNSNMATGIQWGNDHTWSPAAVQMINAQSALSLSGIAWKVMQSRRQSADSLLPAARQWPRSVSAQHRCLLSGQTLDICRDCLMKLGRLRTVDPPGVEQLPVFRAFFPLSKEVGSGGLLGPA